MALKNPTQLFPMVVTADMAATKRFYAEVCGCTVQVDMGHYLQVGFGDGATDPVLCFMTPDGMPDGSVLPAFAGQGVLVSVPTDNADSKHGSVKEKGGAPASEPSSKPWGWRSFLIADPNGLMLDFFHVEKENPMQHASS